MTTPSSTAVPSNLPQDLLYNAEKLDEALNSSAISYLDRFSFARLTLAGAIARISAVNPRGAWATATAYAARDLVSNAGTWYIALDAHTSGATFAGDQAAHWRVHQGLLAVDLADTASPANGDALVGVKRSESGAIATTQHAVNQQRPIYAMADAGCVADGTANDLAALTLADTMAAGVRPIYLPPGTYRINSNVTISSMLHFTSGAMLRPASGVVITLTQPPSAPIAQIFDLSLGGEVRLSRAAGVWAEWWGAKADNATDSAPAIQAACNALVAAGGNGGVINFTNGTYLIGSTVTITDRTIINGANKYTEFKATAGFSATKMFDFVNGVLSQFNCRIQNCYINGNGKAFSAGVVRAASWNEHCGARDITIVNYTGGKGVFVEQFYGGSATWEIDGIEVFPAASAAAGTVGIQVSAPEAVSFFGGGIRHAVVAAPGATPANVVGIQIDGDVVMSMDLLHFEDLNSGVYLLDEANVTIGKITGGAGVSNLFEVASNFVGRIFASAPRQGNATRLLKDQRAAGYTRWEFDDIPMPLLFPPEPGQVIAAARCTGGATPVISGGNAWAKRISAVSRNGAGNYRFTLSPGFGAAQNVHGWAISHETGFRACRLVQQTAATFDLIFEDAAGSAIETSDFTVFVTHKP